MSPGLTHIDQLIIHDHYFPDIIYGLEDKRHPIKFKYLIQAGVISRQPPKDIMPHRSPKTIYAGAAQSGKVLNPIVNGQFRVKSQIQRNTLSAISFRDFSFQKFFIPDEFSFRLFFLTYPL